VGITNSNTKSSNATTSNNDMFLWYDKTKLDITFVKNVANYIKKKLYKINEKELKEILSELTEYLKENKPSTYIMTHFVPESQVLYSGPYWDEQEIMA
jgi:hypothetical protein